MSRGLQGAGSEGRGEALPASGEGGPAWEPAGQPEAWKESGAGDAPGSSAAATAAGGARWSPVVWGSGVDRGVWFLCASL
jgi:hypothetical protein